MQLSIQVLVSLLTESWIFVLATPRLYEEKKSKLHLAIFV